MAVTGTSRRENPLPARQPCRTAVAGSVMGDLPQTRACRSQQEELGAKLSRASGEGDPRAVRRPGRRHLQPRRTRDPPLMRPVRPHQKEVVAGWAACAEEDDLTVSARQRTLDRPRVHTSAPTGRENERQQNRRPKRRQNERRPEARNQSRGNVAVAAQPAAAGPLRGPQRPPRHD